MNKRAIAAIAAGVLTVLGIGILVTWAVQARQQAFDGAKLISVVQVTRQVTVGTSAADLADSTSTVKLPDTAVPDGAVTSLDQVAGLVTDVTLQAGEVLLKARMSTPGSHAKGNIDVPKGMQEVTVNLEGQRTLNGALKPGDKVGIWGSWKNSGDWTALIANQVLITGISSGADANADEGAFVALVVTFAADTPTIERIVYAAEHGKIWLSLQNADTKGSGANRMTEGDFK